MLCTVLSNTKQNQHCHVLKHLSSLILCVLLFDLLSFENQMYDITCDMGDRSADHFMNLIKVINVFHASTIQICAENFVCEMFAILINL